MSELVEWLRAQLDEDEHVAVAVLAGDDANGRWTSDANGEISDGDGYVVAQCEPENHEAQWHIARHDPARVLREVAAKRAIVDLVAEEAAIVGTLRAQSATTQEWFLVMQAYDVLRHLASVYADRPGYREEWKP